MKTNHFIEQSKFWKEIEYENIDENLVNQSIYSNSIITKSIK